MAVGSVVPIMTVPAVERSTTLDQCLRQAQCCEHVGLMLCTTSAGAEAPNTLASLKEACLAMQSAGSTAASTQVMLFRTRCVRSSFASVQDLPAATQHVVP